MFCKYLRKLISASAAACAIMPTKDEWQEWGRKRSVGEIDDKYTNWNNRSRPQPFAPPLSLSLTLNWQLALNCIGSRVATLAAIERLWRHIEWGMCDQFCRTQRKSLRRDYTSYNVLFVLRKFSHNTYIFIWPNATRRRHKSGTSPGQRPGFPSCLSINTSRLLHCAQTH